MATSEVNGGKGETINLRRHLNGPQRDGVVCVCEAVNARNCRTVSERRGQPLKWKHLVAVDQQLDQLLAFTLFHTLTDTHWQTRNRILVENDPDRWRCRTLGAINRRAEWTRDLSHPIDIRCGPLLMLYMFSGAFYP